MGLPVITGVIRRRLLINFRVDPEVMAKQMPDRFRPKLHRGQAIAGICLIRLEAVRPRGLPLPIGIASENAAHRVAVTWSDAGTSREGVFIARRDTGSLLNHLAGGRVFPGEHHRAHFDVTDDGTNIALAMKSADGEVKVDVRGHTAERLPASSSFASLEEASSFFEGGAVGYSVTSDPHRLDGIRLATPGWRIAPLSIDHVASSYFDDPERFPRGSVTLDCALVMRDIEHEWHGEADLTV